MYAPHHCKMTCTALHCVCEFFWVLRIARRGCTGPTTPRVCHALAVCALGRCNHTAATNERVNDMQKILIDALASESATRRQAIDELRAVLTRRLQQVRRAIPALVASQEAAHGSQRL